MITYLAYFVIGFVQDMIIAWQSITTVEERLWPATITSIINTLIGGTVYITLVTIVEQSLLHLVAYAIGGGTGVATLIIIRKRRKNGNIENTDSNKGSKYTDSNDRDNRNDASRINQ